MVLSCTKKDENPSEKIKKGPIYQKIHGKNLLCGYFRRPVKKYFSANYWMARNLYHVQICDPHSLGLTLR